MREKRAVITGRERFSVDGKNDTNTLVWTEYMRFRDQNTGSNFTGLVWTGTFKNSFAIIPTVHFACKTTPKKLGSKVVSNVFTL